MTTLPRIVALLTEKYDAWIVGMAAHPKANHALLNDWDVIVPYDKWNIAAGLLVALVGEENCCPNTFGGWKLNYENISIDVWPDIVQNILTHPRCYWAWQPRIGIRLKAYRG